MAGKKGSIRTVAFKEAIRLRQTGSKNSFFGKKHSPQAIEKIRMATIKRNNERIYKLADVSLKNPDPKVWAYVAGILDGEGSVGFRGSKKRPFVAIYNTSFELIEYLQNAVGGYHVKTLPNKPLQKTIRINYTWQINAIKDLQFFIRNILPYLIIKKQRAQTVLNFINDKYKML